MKKYWIAILSVVLILAMGAASAEAPGSRLGFQMLRELNDGGDNAVISPVSLAFALAMAAQGAQGDTRREMLDALGADKPEDVAGLAQTLSDAGLRLANAAFLAGELTPSEDYVDAIREHFAAEWFEPDGAVMDEINDWVREHTDGLIDRMLEEEPGEDVQLVLMNAAAMDAAWAVPFLAQNTSDAVFHAPGGDVELPFMYEELQAKYAERDGVQILRLGYADSGLTLLLALPKEGGMEQLLDKLCEEGVDYFAFEEEPRHVRLSMPKTDIQSDCTMNDALRLQGVETAFSDQADFSGIAGGAALKLDSVRQKARLIFDEKGTKAAAVTEAFVAACAALAPEETVEFVMDRPFVAVVADEESGAVCFAAVVNNPAGN